MSYLKLKEEANWLHVTLNRPEKKNALSLEFIEELHSVFKNPASHLKGIFLFGGGDVFCAGADLNWIRKAPSQELKKMLDLFNGIQNCPLPVVAHAHGLAYGGGIGLLSVCDFVSADHLTHFCFSEARLGLIPALISFFVSPNLRPWMLSSIPFDVEVALKYDLIQYAGSQKECLEWRKNLISHLDSIPASAYQDNKSFLRKTKTLPLENSFREGLVFLEKRQKDPETQERIARLLDKKKR